MMEKLILEFKLFSLVKQDDMVVMGNFLAVASLVFRFQLLQLIQYQKAVLH